MKTSSTGSPPRIISSEKAKACLIANALICPGVGSLRANDRSGYLQLLLAVGGALYMVGSFTQYFMIYARTLLPPDDVRPYLKRCGVGLAIFFIGWTWSVVTGMAVLRRAKAREGIV